MSPASKSGQALNMPNSLMPTTVDTGWCGFWEKWLEEYKLAVFAQRGLISAHPEVASVEAFCRDTETTSGNGLILCADPAGGAVTARQRVNNCQAALSGASRRGSADRVPVVRRPAGAREPPVHGREGKTVAMVGAAAG
jgi:hypothetical protein